MFSALKNTDIDPSSILAIDDHGREISYGSISALKEEWSGKIPDRRVVALLCANTVPSLSAYLGLQEAGHVVILLSGKIASEALHDILKRFSIEYLVDTEGTVSEFTKTSREPHHDLSVCLSTSGSTGSPKLVRFSKSQLIANAKSIANYLELTKDERPLAHLPFEYSFGLSVAHSHIAVGATLLLTQHSVMEKPFWERLKAATSFSGVPFHFDMLLRMRLQKANLPKMSTFTQAGGKLSQDTAKSVYEICRDKNWKFHIMYGQTEAGPRISWLPHDKLGHHLDCIGQAIPGVKLELKDDGELVVESPSIMMGYALTADELADGDLLNGRLETGDIAQKVVDGQYRIIGRKSRFIKLQGNRVNLSDVENRLAQNDITVHAIGIDDKLVLFTENRDLDHVRQVAVNQFSFSPRSLEIKLLKTVPRLSNDKIDYSALQKIANLAGETK